MQNQANVLLEFNIYMLLVKMLLFERMEKFQETRNIEHLVIRTAVKVLRKIAKAVLSVTNVTDQQAVDVQQHESTVSFFYRRRHEYM